MFMGKFDLYFCFTCLDFVLTKLGSPQKMLWGLTLSTFWKSSHSAAYCLPTDLVLTQELFLLQSLIKSLNFFPTFISSVFIISGFVLYV